MSCDWDEIQKLAADLQSVQFKTTVQKLSERNCIEIVNYLIKSNKIRLIFTTDGKEYVTLDHLRKEICDELDNSSGRLSVNEIAKNLLIDQVHVRKAAQELSSSKNKTICFINDSLIGIEYFRKIIDEVQEQLLEKGITTVNDLIMKWDLPRDIIEKFVLSRLTNITHDTNDPNVFYTADFLKNLSGQIRGFLLGATQPVGFEVLQNAVTSNFSNEKLLFSLIDQLQLPGSFDAYHSKAQYIPNVYLKNMNERIISFFTENDYITFDNMNRFGVKNVKKFLKTNPFNSEPITQLNTCIVAKKLLDNLNASFEECLQRNDWYFDLDQLLPVDFTEKDFDIILKTLLHSNSKKNAVLRIGNCLATSGFLNKLHDLCLDKVKTNVTKIIDNGDYQRYIISSQLTDDSINSTDKKVKKSKKKTSTLAPIKLEFITESEIKETLMKFSKSITDQLNSAIFENHLDEIIELFIDDLQKEGSKLAHDQFQSSITSIVSDQKKIVKDAQEQLNVMLSKIRLFEKGLTLLTSAGDLKAQLTKYLLKTNCQQITDLLIDLASDTCDKFTTKSDEKLERKLAAISHLPNKNQLLKALKATNLEEFLSTVKDFCHDFGIVLHKADRKKDRILIRNHKLELLDQLEKSQNVAETLLLAVLGLFTMTTQNIIHAGGKHVKMLIEFLVQNSYLCNEQQVLLSEYFDLVSKFLNKSIEQNELDEKTCQVKNLLRNFSKKKSSDFADIES